MTMLIPDGREYAIHPGDCIPRMAAMPPASVDLAVFSPPFPAIYAYTSLPEDLGNSEDLKGEVKIHLGFFYRQLARVLKPGRVAMVHLMQIPRMKRAGGQGLANFRDLNARLAERSGLIYEYDWCVRKNPQAQAITTKSRELQFAGLEADRARSRGALPDYLLKLTAPGENAVPIDDDGSVTRNEWIDWAECTWEATRYPIDEKGTLAYTLNAAAGRGQSDTRHICPLQLSIVDRLVRLYSLPGEVVFSPFAGIGSEGFVALRLGRRFYGCEIKPEYLDVAPVNLERAIRMRRDRDVDLFGRLVPDLEEAATEQSQQPDPAPPAESPIPADATDEDLSARGLARVFGCNRCNAYRAPDFHPCPACRCPEYRIVAVPSRVGRAEKPAEERAGKKRGRKGKAEPAMFGEEAADA